MTQTVIAIAGYMGSGKTTCARLLTSLGGCEISADLEAKKMMIQSEPIKRRLSDAFGADILIDDAVHFSELGNRSFKTPETIAILNSIVHPALIDHLRACIKSKSSTVIVLDAALIPLWNIENWFDYRIWVSADFQTRLNRLADQRLKGVLSKEELIRRINIQEELFQPPSEDAWVYIENEYSEKEFVTSVIEWIRTVPVLAQSLYLESHF